MKNRSVLLSLLLMATAFGQDAAPSPAEAARSYEVSEPQTLEVPYYGVVAPSFSTCGPTARRSALVVLNTILPPGADGAPRLANSANGTDFTDVHVMRDVLPTPEQMAGMQSYDEFVELLGAPTEQAATTNGNGSRAEDTAVWRLFAPAEGDRVTVLQVSMQRSWDPALPTPVYTVECFGLQGGGMEVGATGPLFAPGTPGELAPLVESPVVSPS
jgi:hypothetical protein